MARGLFSFFVMVTIACRPASLSAWNDAGHMTIARIAWDVISADDRSAIIEMLRQHPHLDSLLRLDRPAATSDEEWIFLRASVWADYVRPPKAFPKEDVGSHPLYKFHRGNWHYVNFPYERGQKIVGVPANALPESTNILKQLEKTMDILTGRGSQEVDRVEGLTDIQNRAVRLTWLFHLVGDLHQPLHTIALIDRSRFPDPPYHDQGGNKLAVRSDVGSKPKNLHWCWDELSATDSRFDVVCRQAERLTHDPALRPDFLPELNRHPNFRDWANESYEAAVAHAYLNGNFPLVLWDDFNSGQITENEIPVFPADALKTSKAVSQRRIVLAGYRLAAKLKEIAHKGPKSN